ncbi:hypothetical protein BZG36_01088 [Bifiguratus adelaidae]|uniref:AAA+ ATPase domain-containing protein n=1 Tax=Bifiguratus adelaidae TaxID=1938954 RepID=A0A261Y654_9FUNG|nr:hypothetical protein BZG36_01088 [Bifiguratus adelaidae]
MATVPPPPPPPLATRSAAQAIRTTGGENFEPFIVKGTSKNEAVFEFPNPSERLGSVNLRAIVGQYLTSPQLRDVPAYQLYMVLGRLRCLYEAMSKYNEGIHALTPIFLQYWRQRTLNLMAGFGFHITDAQQAISIVGLEELVRKVEDLFQEDIKEARQLIQRGSIIFDSLGELYHPGATVQGKTTLGGTPGIFLVVESYFEEHRSLLGMEKSFHWTMEFVATMGNHFTLVNFTEVLSGWTGVRTRPLSELTYGPLDSTEKASLQKRGENYVQFGVGGAKFLAYAPNTFFLHSPPTRQGSMSLSGSGSNQLPLGGRVMIDAARGATLGHHASQGMDEPTLAMVNIAGRYKRWVNTNSTSAAPQDALLLWDTVPEEMCIYCWPALVGFSFTAKAWGHVLVSGIEPIKFHDDAFDRLVLAEERKQLIRALVRFGSEADAEDIIGGKRGRSVFLFHGPPGVGKTLTAEAIAEVLHRPLYYVTMGELGIAPDDMERRLGDVLELCADWNAITLLDEADVFLEKRSISDLVRNSMVCVMLRLLEYHPGILFLTTNRVRNFDPAFESRVTIALRYEPLSPEARVQIWRNLLERASISISGDVNHENLAKHVMNGRQIKNAVRLAVALAKERQETTLSQAVLENTLQITSLGRQEMKNDDSWVDD